MMLLGEISFPKDINRDMLKRDIKIIFHTEGNRMRAASY